MVWQCPWEALGGSFGGPCVLLGPSRLTQFSTVGGTRHQLLTISGTQETVQGEPDFSPQPGAEVPSRTSLLGQVH